MPSIQIFGDSIAHGGRDLERGGWPLRIRRHMSAHGLGDAGFVQARSGDTSFDVCKRMPIEIALRGSETVIIAIGTNDAQILGDSRHPRVTDNSCRPDGIHPDSEGHARMAEAIWAGLVPTGCLGERASDIPPLTLVSI